MTVSEIHVSLGVVLQKVNTHKSKNFLPQELDMLFNMTLLNFKNKKVDLVSNPKQVSLFDTQTSLDNLSSLFETVTLYPTTTNSKEAIIQLPFNFYGWIRCKANIAYDCSTAYNTSPNGISFYNSKLSKLKKVNLTTLEGFNISITYTTKDNNTITALLFSYANLPADYMPQDNVKDYKRSFVFINAITKTISESLLLINEDAKTPVFFKYDNQFDVLEFTSNSPLTLTLTTEQPNIAFVNTNTASNLINLLQPLESPITVSDTEYEDFIDNSYLSKSRDTNLRAVRTRETLLIKIPKNVKLSSVTLSYIRFPRQIDYLLDISTDLPDDVINKVITDTAQFIKGVIASDSYDKFVKENLLIE